MNQPQLAVPVVFHNVLVIFIVLCFDFPLQDLEAHDSEKDPVPVHSMETSRYVTALQTDWDIFVGFQVRRVLGQ